MINKLKHSQYLKKEEKGEIKYFFHFLENSNENLLLCDPGDRPVTTTSGGSSIASSCCSSLGDSTSSSTSAIASSMTSTLT